MSTIIEIAGAAILVAGLFMLAPWLGVIVGGLVVLTVGASIDSGGS
jgi:hypothetical protein